MEIKEQEQIIWDMAKGVVLEELNYYIETAEAEEWESIENTVDAFDYVVDNGEAGNYTPAIVRQLRKIEIALGRYHAISDKELEGAVCISGGRSVKAYDFKLEGVKYVRASLAIWLHR